NVSSAGGGANAAPRPGVVGAPANPGDRTLGGAGTPQSGTGGGQAGSGGSTAATAAKESVDVLAGRSVIRTAQSTVRVARVLDASTRVSALAAADGGYVAGEETDARPEHPDEAEAVLTLRVPADRLGHLL